MKQLFFTILLGMFLFSSSLAQTPSGAENVSLDKKIGQLLLVGFRGTTVADTNHIVRDIKKYHLGGVILFDYDVPSQSSPRNITSPDQLSDLIRDLKELSNSQLIISIDQEGGQVARLKPSMGFPDIVSAEYLGNLNNADSTKHYAQQMAETLNKLGITMNFAPVVDLNTNPNNPVIGKIDRSFSADPQTVIKHAEIYINTFRNYNIIPVLKHFPGHGSSKKDSHLGVVDITDTWSKKELIPYRTLVNKGLVNAIMTAHIFNHNLDANYPATLSEPIIQDLLRDKLEFKGVVISDDLMMGAIRNEYGLKTTITKAINAGVDILVFANNSVYDPEIVPKAHNIIKELIKEGEISRQQIDESYARIMKLKRKIGD